MKDKKEDNMKIYNTKTRSLEDFKTLEEGKVRMYVCGPTVYSFIHIGNARPMIFFDTVRRYLMYKGYDVNYVSNFTDVDDKIIKRANEEGVDSSVISTRYIDECRKDMKSLNIMPATTNPLATEEIGGMIEMIQTLIDKGYAYVAKDGTVYYRTRKFAQYGKLSHKNLDDLRSGERDLKVSGEDQKEDPLDFVLWKPKKEGEPYWESPWCNGRPGWHIECSVMSKRYLGEQIDIHGGGEDLIFPHHENEIAQSEACSGKEFATYWMHNAFLRVDNVKMSKSAGNFFNVRDIIEKYDPMVVRLFMLSSHYRSPLNFSEELISAAKTSYERIVNCKSNLDFLLDGERTLELTENEQKVIGQMAQLHKKYESVMEDDFNTADAISCIFELVRLINSNAKESSSRAFLQKADEELHFMTDICGIIITKDNDEDVNVKEIQKLIDERQAARKAKDFARADEIRGKLLDMGIVLEDTREGVKWKKA